MTTDETRTLVESYFRAWSSGDCDRGRTMMADELTFVTPINRYDSADAVLPQLKRFTTFLKKATLLRSVVEGEQAVLLYETELPAPAGVLRTVEVMKVANGKIRSIELVYDPAGLRKLLYP